MEIVISHEVGKKRIADVDPGVVEGIIADNP